MLMQEMNEFRKCSLGREVDFLRADEEKALWLRWKNHQDGKARDRILESHLPLCRAMSLEWARKCNVPVQDPFGEAELTMVRYFDHFDPAHDTQARFCSYI